MTYTKTGPFTNNAAPAVTATFLNNVETALAASMPNTATVFGPADLNTAFTQSGAYRGSNLTNAPGGSAASFMVVVQYQDSSTQVQTAYDLANRVAWWRRQNLGAWTSWHQYADDGNVAALAVQDTGWVTSSTGITAASGWSLVSAKYRILNGVAYLSVQATKTGSTITAGASGNLTNTPVFNLPSALIPSSSNGNYGNSGGNASFLASGFASQDSSAIVLAVAAPSYAIAAGAVADLMGSHVL